jgi:ABC-2 type transport system ATP-binding protein
MVDRGVAAAADHGEHGHVLELDGLTKRYGHVVALDDASFDARRGRILGFLGPNGAGKTTAMRSIFGLVALDAGEIRWDGAAVDPSMRSGFGYMPEQRGLYPKMKTADQLTWLGRLRGMDAGAARDASLRWLERLGLGDRTDERVERLSHGNQQRAQLAASLVHDPDLLVLDEPFSGLDPMGADAMAGILRDRAAAGAAVVFSSHQLDVVEDLCEDLAIISHGRIVLEGTIEDVREAAPKRRLEVGFEDPATIWEPPIPHETARDGQGIQAWLVPAGSDLAALLQDARGCGHVTRFGFAPPALSEIFREAVG